MAHINLYIDERRILLLQQEHSRKNLKTGLARRQEDDGAGAHLKTDTKKRDKRDSVSSVRVQRVEPGGRE